MTAISLPPGFSWLSPACRPSPEEVQTYAEIISEIEHNPPERFASCLREAELQLWIWRNDARKRAPRRRRSQRTTHAALDSDDAIASSG